MANRRTQVLTDDVPLTGVGRRYKCQRSLAAPGSVARISPHVNKLSRLLTESVSELFSLSSPPSVHDAAL